MSKILHIAKFSILDQFRQKSFYFFLAACILLVLLLRGCYKGNITVNSRQIDNLTIAWHASKFAFHMIAGGMMLLIILVSMSIFTKDHQNGNMVLMLSRPIKRSDYLLGRSAGVWIIGSTFMFILHLTIVIIAFMNTGEIAAGFFPASLICSLNLLFLIFLVGLLSLFLPDFIAALTVIGVAGISFISDSVYLAKHSPMFQSILSSGIENQVAIWRILWPKTAMLQYYAASFLEGNGFKIMGPVPPVVNILIYILLSYLLLLWAFNRQEI